MIRWTIILVTGLLTCGAATATADRIEYVNEGFEGQTFPPAGWAIITNAPSYAWFQTDARRHTGEYSAMVHYSPVGVVQDEWLVTPAMNTVGATSLALTFWNPCSTGARSTATTTTSWSAPLASPTPRRSRCSWT